MFQYARWNEKCLLVDPDTPFHWIIEGEGLSTTVFTNCDDNTIKCKKHGPEGNLNSETFLSTIQEDAIFGKCPWQDFKRRVQSSMSENQHKKQKWKLMFLISQKTINVISVRLRKEQEEQVSVSQVGEVILCNNKSWSFTDFDWSWSFGCEVRNPFYLKEVVG